MSAMSAVFPPLHLPRFVPRGDGTIAVPTGPVADEGDAAPQLLVAGDWANIRLHADAAARAPEALYGGLAAVIALADFALVNLECALGGTVPIPKDGPNLQGGPAATRALREAGFHAACLANNHVLDFGSQGLDATLDACRRAGLETVGAGRDLEQAFAPLVRDVGGLRVGVFNICDREEGDAAWNRAGVAPAFDLHLLDRLRSLRARCDFLCAIVHGGKEYTPVPPPYWFERVIALAGAGADLVVGHHPHIPQGVVLAERPGGAPVPVVFSTGNFVFRPAAPDGATIPPHTADGYLVRARIRPGRVAALDLVPFRIAGAEGPRPLAGSGETARFAALLEKLSAPLASRASVEAWFTAFARHLWQHGYRARVAGLTAKVCEGDAAAARHARSHHQSPAHATLISEVMRDQLEPAQLDPVIARNLEAWFRHGWFPAASS